MYYDQNSVWRHTVTVLAVHMCLFIPSLSSTTALQLLLPVDREPRQQAIALVLIHDIGQVFEHQATPESFPYNSESAINVHIYGFYRNSLSIIYWYMRVCVHPTFQYLDVMIPCKPHVRHVHDDGAVGLR